MWRRERDLLGRLRGGVQGCLVAVEPGLVVATPLQSSGVAQRPETGRSDVECGILTVP
jgi:hypothetical protein